MRGVCIIGSTLVAEAGRESPHVRPFEFRPASARPGDARPRRRACRKRSRARGHASIGTGRVRPGHHYRRAHRIARQRAPADGGCDREGRAGPAGVDRRIGGRCRGEPVALLLPHPPEIVGRGRDAARPLTALCDRRHSAIDPGARRIARRIHDRPVLPRPGRADLWIECAARHRCDRRCGQSGGGQGPRAGWVLGPRLASGKRGQRVRRQWPGRQGSGPGRMARRRVRCDDRWRLRKARRLL